MAEDFLGEFIGNPARARAMRAFLFNQQEPISAARLVKLAGINSKSALKEIKTMEKLGIIKKSKPAKGRKIQKGEKKEEMRIVDPDFKYIRALSSFVHAVFPIRYGNIVNSLRNSGRLSVVVVSGCFVGDLTRPVDMIVVADNINDVRLEHAIKALEPLFGREIRYTSFTTPEFEYRLTIQDRLIRETLDYPHMVLLDRQHLL